MGSPASPRGAAQSCAGMKKNTSLQHVNLVAKSKYTAEYAAPKIPPDCRSAMTRTPQSARGEPRNRRSDEALRSGEASHRRWIEPYDRRWTEPYDRRSGKASRSALDRTLASALRRTLRSAFGQSLAIGAGSNPVIGVEANPTRHRESRSRERSVGGKRGDRGSGKALHGR